MMGYTLFHDSSGVRESRPEPDEGCRRDGGAAGGWDPQYSRRRRKERTSKVRVPVEVRLGVRVPGRERGGRMKGWIW